MLKLVLLTLTLFVGMSMQIEDMLTGLSGGTFVQRKCVKRCVKFLKYLLEMEAVSAESVCNSICETPETLATFVESFADS